MNYFVSVQGKIISNNLEKQQAIDLAVKEHDKNTKLGGIQIGIGRIRWKNRQKVYIMLPYFYYL